MYRAVKYAHSAEFGGGKWVGRATAYRVHPVVARQRVRHRRDDPRLRAILIEPVCVHHHFHGDPNRGLRGPGHPDARDDVDALLPPGASRGVGRRDPRLRGREHHECVLGVWRGWAGRPRGGARGGGGGGGGRKGGRDGGGRGGRGRGGGPGGGGGRAAGPARPLVLPAL